tara:strand:- start:2807 stop:3265 length:459 start_codon:yes stop_codon:yes gene_type:complete
MLKKIILLIIILSFSHCGYTSIYTNLNNSDLNIKIGEFQGDQDINNSLRRKFKRFSNNNLDKEIFLIDIKSSYKKIIASKDSTGSASDYKIENNIEFIVRSNDKTENITYSESVNMTKMEDVFEEKQYELTIKENFASSVSEKLIQRLSISK